MTAAGPRVPIRATLRRFCDEFHYAAGNPFRPVTFLPAWRTAAGLAAVVDAGGHFDRLPALADALEDAGCDAAEVLAHCRGGGPHARGCWAADGLLGR